VRLPRLSVRLLCTAAIALCLLSCATTRMKTEAFLFSAPEQLDSQKDAWLRTVEIVSNSLPLSEDYALVRDSLAAIGSKYDFRLSSAQGQQPFIVDLAIHEHSYIVDVTTSNSVMAILNVYSSSDLSFCVARVVHSAVMADSVTSLYQVAEIAETVFASLQKEIAKKALSKK
jgi:hypothetical protein